MTLSVDAALAEIEARLPDVQGVSVFIHDHPELAYEEHQAHDYFVGLLTRLGIRVTPHAYGVATAFEAEVGSGGRLVVFNAEYDALPGLGHACGHNLIAAASLTSFLGVAAALRTAGPGAGRVRLLGTPAEEGGGGKLRLISAGAFRNVDACLMVHPAPQWGMPSEGIHGIAYAPMLANEKWRVAFTGRAAHAAMDPWDGLNALDAVCLGYNAVSMLRQQIRPADRIHGALRGIEGQRPNVIPATAGLEYYIRSPTRASAHALWRRVRRCFVGAATATGCTASFTRLNSYADVRASRMLCRAYADAMGPSVLPEPPTPGFVLAGSTDMGNVCYECPGFHGGFGIVTTGTGPGFGNHAPGFTPASATPDALARAIDCGRGMAKVGVRILADDVFAAAVRAEWEADMAVAAEEQAKATKDSDKDV